MAEEQLCPSAVVWQRWTSKLGVAQIMVLWSCQSPQHVPVLKQSLPPTQPHASEAHFSARPSLCPDTRAPHLKLAAEEEGQQKGPCCLGTALCLSLDLSCTLGQTKQGPFGLPDLNPRVSLRRTAFGLDKSENSKVKGTLLLLAVWPSTFSVPRTTGLCCVPLTVLDSYFCTHTDTHIHTDCNPDSLSVFIMVLDVNCPSNKK